MLRNMGRIGKRALGLALAALATACATVPPGPPPGPALWRLGDADTTIYLFGTVHALPANTVWFTGPVEQAFTASDEIVTELDPADLAGAGADFLAAATLPENTSLRALMNDQDRAEYEAALARLGVPVATLDRYEPWYAALYRSLLPLMQSGYEPDAGVELVLASRSAGKRRAALESITDQIILFDGLPREAQLRMLDEAVEASPNAAAMLDAMVDRWMAGDADGLAELMNAEMDDPALTDRLLVGRNATWADWIAARLERPGTVFIAVGAGHLAGTGSVQEMLAARGLAVSRVNP